MRQRGGDSFLDLAEALQGMLLDWRWLRKRVPARIKPELERHFREAVSALFAPAVGDAPRLARALADMTDLLASALRGRGAARTTMTECFGYLLILEPHAVPPGEPAVLTQEQRRDRENRLLQEFERLVEINADCPGPAREALFEAIANILRLRYDPGIPLHLPPTPRFQQILAAYLGALTVRTARCSQNVSNCLRMDRPDARLAPLSEPST